MEPAKISVAEIIVAINENIDATRCGGEKNCHGDETCLTHQLWEDLSIRIHEFLNGITLGDLVTKPHVQEVASRQEGRMHVVAN
jgi:Rrf2 family iron-sulfur cluster assembly transcriptional regulator